MAFIICVPSEFTPCHPAPRPPPSPCHVLPCPPRCFLGEDECAGLTVRAPPSSASTHGPTAARPPPAATASCSTTAVLVAWAATAAPAASAYTCRGQGATAQLSSSLAPPAISTPAQAPAPASPAPAATAALGDPAALAAANEALTSPVEFPLAQPNGSAAANSALCSRISATSNGLSYKTPGDHLRSQTSPGPAGPQRAATDGKRAWEVSHPDCRNCNVRGRQHQCRPSRGQHRHRRVARSTRGGGGWGSGGAGPAAEGEVGEEESQCERDRSEEAEQRIGQHRRAAAAMVSSVSNQQHMCSTLCSTLCVA